MAKKVTNVFNVLHKALITEKSAVVSSLSNTAVFAVHPDASKGDIKDAVETLLNVKVRHVRVANYLGKPKKNRKGAVARRKSWKKAYVSLAEGNTVELMEGLS